MEIRAVFFDIDGTLLMDNRSVSPSTIFAINQLKKAGILVGLATGRDPRFILQYMAALSLDLAIAYNGQYIFSREKVLYADPLQVDDVRSLIQYARQENKDLSFGTASGVAGSGIMSFGGGHLAYRISRMIPESWAGLVNFIFNRLIRRLRPQKEANVEEILQQPIYQLLLLATEKETTKLQGRYPGLEFTRSSPYAADIINKGGSKLQGIQRLANQFQFGLDQVIVFGDSNNDLEMLAGVEHSVAMKNATRKAKKAASFVTDSNNKDGIFKALERFGLVKERD
ncbi:HAD-IIB family hydrolase [Streptococcus suis]|uniref:HAD-IIB family hydrolase n=1 Tax=Streptococcus suis TaxID=1307 RepID=UPI001FCA316A